jgi:hypothetical protein
MAADAVPHTQSPLDGSGQLTAVQVVVSRYQCARRFDLPAASADGNGIVVQIDLDGRDRSGSVD